jgi:hypothetical protein
MARSQAKKLGAAHTRSSSELAFEALINPVHLEELGIKLCEEAMCLLLLLFPPSTSTLICHSLPQCLLAWRRKRRRRRSNFYIYIKCVAHYF